MGVGGTLNFQIPWNFIKEDVLHNFMKHFFVIQVNQIIKTSMVKCLVLAICDFQLLKKWWLQNCYSIKKWMMLQNFDENVFEIMTIPNKYVLSAKMQFVKN